MLPQRHLSRINFICCCKRWIGQMYPVAWVVAKVECKVTCDWFLRVLKDDLQLGDGKGLVVMTNMQKVFTLPIKCLSIY